jgi:hypothetical protein
MTRDKLAALLNGRNYGEEITKDECATAEAHGLVVVFGYSDDNVELRGAIDEEVGAGDGAKLKITPDGLLPDWVGFRDSEQRESAFERYFAEKAKGVHTIEALWAPKDTAYSWMFQTTIPHATFEIVEDGEPFCRGIVFSLAELEPTTQASFLSEDPDHAQEEGAPA